MIATLLQQKGVSLMQMKKITKKLATWTTFASLGIGCGFSHIAVALAQTARTPIAQPTEILVHGHRGARTWRPENTIPAFKFAIEQGADVLELDLAVTKDNQLVVSHNPTLAANSYPGERTCVGPKLEPKTPIRTKVATFDEVLDLASGTTVQFNVETKSFPNHPEVTPPPAEFVALIVSAIKKHKVDPSRIILQSFDWRTLAEMRKQWPEIRLSALVGRPQYDGLMGHTDPTKDFVAIAKETGAEIISPDWMLVTPEQVASAHAYGVQVAPWTADTPEEWQKLADAHVDAIISDDPVGLLAWLRAQKPPLHP